MRDPFSCSHQSWQYARRVHQDGTQHFCVQCTECLGVAKLRRHQQHLYLKITDIPANASIHPWIEGDCDE